MKLQVTLASTALASLLLDANAAVDSLARKREGSLPESFITSADDNVNVSPVAALKLTEEEELFLRYLQEDSSHSFSLSGPTASPSSKPSARPSAKPTASPSKRPTSSPSKNPTRPPVVGTFAPTKAPVITGDAQTEFQKMQENTSTLTYNGDLYRLVDCDFVRKKPSVRCDMDKVKSHCPVACSASQYMNEDSTAVFYSPDVRERTCKWVAKNTEKRCKKKNYVAYCPNTCGDKKAEDTAGSFFALPSNACKYVGGNINKRCTWKVAKKHCPETCGLICPSGEECATTDAPEGKTFPVPFERYTCSDVAALNYNKRQRRCKKSWMKSTCRKTCAEFA